MSESLRKKLTFLAKYSYVFILLLIFLIMSFATDKFLTVDNLLNEIDALMKHIGQHKEALEAGDREKIRELLKKGRILKQHNASEKKIIYD